MNPQQITPKRISDEAQSEELFLIVKREQFEDLIFFNSNLER